MASTRAGRLVQDPDDPSPATPVELFFDVVYVFVFFRLTEAITDQLSWGSLGATTILLLAFWWVWSHTNLATDTVNANRPAVQAYVIATAFGVLLMSSALPEAYEARGLLFAGGYVAIHLGRSLFLAYALRGHALWRRPLRGLVWFGVSGLWWLGGVLVEDWGRVVFWLIAITIDYLAPLVRWPTPMLGYSPSWEWRGATRHLAERYQQFVIIAIGEIILIDGRTFRRGEVNAERTAAFILSFLTAVLLWWIYFHSTRDKLATPVSALPDRAHEGSLAGAAHLMMISGIVLTSARTELILEEPLGATPTTWAAVIAGGPLLFLLGRTLFETEARGRLSRVWLLGAGMLLVSTPVLRHLAPLYGAAVTAAILLGIVSLNRISTNTRP